MINKGKGRNRYIIFERKIFISFIILIMAGSCAVLLLRNLFRGQLGNKIVAGIQLYTGMDNVEAIMLYRRVIRNHINEIIFGCIVLVILIMLRICIAWTTKYFDEISQGMGLMLEQREEKIVLSKELGFVEERMNECREKLRNRERAAREAESKKNDLVVYLAHDMKTPLTSVIGYLELVTETQDMKPEQREKYLNLTLEKANRLEELMNEFFEITRYNLQEIKLDKKEIDLIFMLQQMVDEFYPRLKEKQQRALLEASGQMAIIGDGDKLGRVFHNIFKNAVTYGRQGSQIWIKADSDETWTTVTFSNEGEDIPQEQLDKLFEKFYRMDYSRATGTGNAGLGLAIAKEIITLHKGELRADSNNGVITFTIRLPLRES